MNARWPIVVTEVDPVRGAQEEIAYVIFVNKKAALL